MMHASGKRRFTRQHPCPICGGTDRDPRGQGRRCFGFLSGDGEWAHCTRAEYAGPLRMHAGSQTYPHKLHGACHCGVTHAPAHPSHERSTTSHTGARRSQNRSLLVAYNYQTASGELLFQCVRWDPKGFSQRHPDGAGGWIWNLEGITPVLYRLPELLAADQEATVWIVEGEKDVETLRGLGLVATCNPMGASKWRSSYNQSLKGRRVVILPDNDRPGRNHAQEVAWHLHSIAKSVKVLALPESHKDVSDYLAAGGSLETLLEAVHTASEWEDPHAQSRAPQPEAVALLLETMTLRQVLDMEFTAPEWVIPNMVPRGQVTVFAGKPKVGKSWWVFGGALAVTEGAKAFQHSQCAQAPVLYLALEDTPRRLKGRGLKLLTGRDLHGIQAPDYLHLATACPRLDAGAVELMDAWLEEHPDCALIILDTLAKVKPARARNGDLYAEDYGCVQGLLELAHRRNVGILLVTHCRKMSGEDVFDEINASTGLLGAAETAIVMRRRRGEDTATLHITGKDVDEQELAMQFCADTGSWMILGDAADCAETAEQQEILDALDALGGEASPKAIKEELGPGRSHSAIKQRLWRMAQKGLLVATDGKYRRNEATPGATTPTAQSGITAVTGVTPVTDVTAVTARERNSGPDETNGTKLEGNTVTLVTAVTAVTPVTRLESELAPDQAATALIRVSDLIEPEALSHARTLLVDEARTLVLQAAEGHGWRSLEVDGWARGGGAFSWKRMADEAGLPKLLAILAAMQHVGWKLV